MRPCQHTEREARHIGGIWWCGLPPVWQAFLQQQGEIPIAAGADPITAMQSRFSNSLKPRFSVHREHGNAPLFQTLRRYAARPGRMVQILDQARLEVRGDPALGNAGPTVPLLDDDDRSPPRHSAIEIDDILKQQADATARYGSTYRAGIHVSMQPVKRVPAALVDI